MAREMRDSGVQWLGCIPDDWGVEQAGQALYQVKNKNTGMVENNLLSLSYGRVKRRDIDARGGLLPESFEGYNIVEADDIVLRFTDLQNDQRSLRTGRVTERGIITSAYTTVRPVNTEASRFLYYALHAYDLRKGFYGMGSGVRQGLKWQEAKYILIPKPSDDEQRRIADYLDAKCAEIDRAIEAAERSIEEYGSYFTATVDSALSDAHGSVRLSRLCSVITDGDHQPPPRADSGVPFLVISNISKGYISFEHCDHVPEEYYDAIPPYKRAAKGDLLFTVTGSYGLPVLVDCDERFCFQRHIALLKPLIEPEYLYFAMQTSIYRQYCDLVATGAAQKTVSLSSLRSSRIPLFDAWKRAEIVSRLQEIESSVKNAITAKQSIIDDLKAYKQSLVYEVVTGKREV